MLEAHIRLSLTDPMTVLSVSDGVEALLGFKPDDFLAGKVSLKNLIHAHDQDIAANLFSTELNKASGTFNIRLRQANGRIQCIKGHYTKEPDASGREAILELQLQDAKSLWQGLGDQPMMANFKAMMENADDYIYFKDRNHVFNGASQTLVAITAPSEHWTDLLGLTDYDVFPEEYADVYYRLGKQVFAGIPVAREIQETLDNDGNKGWVDNRKYSIKNVDGEIIGLFGIARDITERKQAEQVLQESETLFRQMTENIREVFWIGTPDWNEVLYISPAYEEIWGRSCESLYARPLDWLDAVVAVDREQVIDAIRRKSAGDLSNVTFPGYRILRPDGSERWIHARAFPVRDAEGKVYRVAGIAEDITERKQMEEKLQLTQFASDQAPDCIFWIDKQARICYANKMVWRELGYTKEELLAMSIPDIDPDFPAAAWPDHWQELQQKNALTFETRHRRKDGSIFPVEVSANFVKFGDKEFNVAFTRNITERKRSEERIQQSEGMLRTIIGTIRDLIWLKDPDGFYLACNPMFERFFGAKEAEIVGKTDYDFVDKELADFFREHDRKAMAKGGPSVNEEEVTFADDRHHALLETVKTPMYDKSGRLIGVLGIARDITERKQTEEQLRIAATAFESQESMVITDANGVIMRVNHAFTEATGYTAEEAVGQTPRLLKSGRHDADFYREMWGTLQRTGKWQGEIWDRRKNGEIYPKLLTISAVKGDDGVVTHYVGADHDITKRKAAEKETNNLAFYDSLTQLPNRRLLNDRMGKTMAASKRSGRHGAVMFLDLDNFKPLNDTHGHNVGDLLLVEVARRIAHCVREMDTAARFGGDEFVVVLSELDEDKAESVSQAAIVAEKIRTTLAEPYVLKIQPEGKAETTVEHHCTSSIGVVLFVNHEDSAEDILKWADMAMYQAKEAGRNQIRFYESKA